MGSLIEHTAFLSQEECDHLTHIILRDEQEILNISNDQNNGYTGLTKQFNVYNWLNHEEVASLNIPQRLFSLPQFAHRELLHIQCWANILSQGEDLPMHFHMNQTDFDALPEEEKNDEWYLSNLPSPMMFAVCNLHISSKSPSYTYYASVGNIQNKPGALHIIPPWEDHKVPTYLYTQPRISMALDIHYNIPNNANAVFKSCLRNTD